MEAAAIIPSKMHHHLYIKEKRQLPQTHKMPITHFVKQ